MTTQHEYGPHRPDDAPQTVTVRGPERWGEEKEVPVSAAILRQRRNINNRAWDAAQRRVRS